MTVQKASFWNGRKNEQNEFKNDQIYKNKLFSEKTNLSITLAKDANSHSHPKNLDVIKTNEVLYFNLCQRVKFEFGWPSFNLDTYWSDYRFIWTDHSGHASSIRGHLSGDITD